MSSIITKPPGLKFGNCCYVCKHSEIQKEVCKKHLRDTLLYLVCDDFEIKSAYGRYLDRMNV